MCVCWCFSFFFSFPLKGAHFKQFTISSFTCYSCFGPNYIKLAITQSFLLKTAWFCTRKPLLSSKETSLRFVCHCHDWLFCRVSLLDAVSNTYPGPYHCSKVLYGFLDDDLAAYISIVLFVKVGGNSRNPILQYFKNYWWVCVREMKFVFYMHVFICSRYKHQIFASFCLFILIHSVN